MLAASIHPNAPPDCSYIHLAVQPDQQAFYIAKANEWAASPDVGPWFNCHANDVMNWFTYAQQQAARKEPALGPVEYLFKYGCFGGCDFPKIWQFQTFIVQRPIDAGKCDSIDYSWFYGGHYFFGGFFDALDGVDPDAQTQWVTEMLPMAHADIQFYMCTTKAVSWRQ